MTSYRSARARVILPIVTLALLALSPALAAPLPPATTVTVEVTELDPKGARQVTLRFTLALSDRLPSELDATTAQARYHVRVSRDDSKGKAPLVRLDLRRDWRHGRVNETVKLRVAGRVAPGQRVVMGQVPRPGGGSLQVVLQLS